MGDSSENSDEDTILYEWPSSVDHSIDFMAGKAAVAWMWLKNPDLMEKGYFQSSI
jgi:hypothetical protein